MNYTDKNLVYPDRLDGLDFARFAAFAGMVFVNFKITMGAVNDTGLASLIVAALEGRAAATFIVLAGIGMGLQGLRSTDRADRNTLKRAAFLLVLGLLNMQVFDADILHYYAFYLVLGMLARPLTSRALIAIIFCLNAAFVMMVVSLDYNAGWNWENYSYQGFWTAQGFIRNLMFNGWHPVVPWFGFLLFGLIISRLKLSDQFVQHRLIGYGALVLVLAEIPAYVIPIFFSGLESELSELASTKPVPPMPLYAIASAGNASVVIGLSLRFTETLRKCGLLAITTAAGRQTLTLYLAHILVGMGTLEALDMLGNQTMASVMIAASIFCFAAMIYAILWARFFDRGPIESIMRKVTA